MTEAEWKALDAHIARLMGWCKWDELPAKAHEAYWKMMEEKPEDWTLAYNRERWWFVNKSGYPDSDERIEDWRPHEYIDQALEAVDKFVRDGWWFDLFWRRGTKIGVRIWKPAGPDLEGRGETYAKAVCLTIKQLRDVQKEKQDDQN